MFTRLNKLCFFRNGGYKSKGMHARHSDSDDEDWC